MSKSFNPFCLRFLILIFLFEISKCDTNKNIFSQKNKSHVFQPSCNQWTGVMSSTAKRQILNAHNTYRNQVALGLTRLGSRLPFAKNMLQMYWSDDLATKAQQWANGCMFSHSSNSYRRMAGYTAGESIYMSGSSAGFQQMDWRKPINTWFNEINSLNPNLIYSFQSSSAVGHFTQLIWAKSYLIGCGFAQFFQGGFYRNFYVCQYGPAGNIINYPVYNPSTILGCACPSGTSCSNNILKGLCCPDGYCSNDAIYNRPSIN